MFFNLSGDSPQDIDLFRFKLASREKPSQPGHQFFGIGRIQKTDGGQCSFQMIEHAIDLFDRGRIAVKTDMAVSRDISVSDKQGHTAFIGQNLYGLCQDSVKNSRDWPGC